MKRLIYIDTYSTGTLHEMFNAASLKMFATIYPQIEYYADKTTKEHMIKLIKELPSNVTYHRIHVPFVKSTITNILKIIYAIWNNSRAIIIAKKNDVIYINYNTIYALPFINLFAKWTKKKVLLQCHGELNQFQKGFEQNYISQKCLSLLSSQHVKLAANLYICILGQSIEKNLRAYISKQATEKIITYDHPGSFQENVSSYLHSNILKIGCIGTLRKTKGLNSYITLSSEFKSYKKQILFYSIGRIMSDPKLFTDAGIIIPKKCSNRYLTREEMYQLATQLDVILYLYSEDSYRLTASGAIFDAIDCERPILALKNDYFEYIFTKVGPLGYLANNMDDLKKELIQLKNGKRYNINFKSAKEYLKSENIAKELQKKLININFV